MRKIPLLIVLAACVSEPPCELDGEFRIVAHESKGDCGPLPDNVQSVGASMAMGCMRGSYRAGPDDGEECVVTYSNTCRAPDGSTVIVGVSVQREEDDETWTGAGDVQIWDPAGKVLCHSLYFLTFIKQ